MLSIAFHRKIMAEAVRIDEALRRLGGLRRTPGPARILDAGTIPGQLVPAAGDDGPPAEQRGGPGEPRAQPR